MIHSGTGRVHLDQPGNWSVARDTVWELEGYTWTSKGTEREHVIQSGNWRVARRDGSRGGKLTE